MPVSRGTSVIRELLLYDVLKGIHLPRQAGASLSSGVRSFFTNLNSVNFSKVTGIDGQCDGHRSAMWWIQVSNQDCITKSLCKMQWVKFPALNFPLFFKAKFLSQCLRSQDETGGYRGTSPLCKAAFSGAPCVIKRGKGMELYFLVTNLK